MHIKKHELEERGGEGARYIPFSLLLSTARTAWLALGMFMNGEPASNAQSLLTDPSSPEEPPPPSASSAPAGAPCPPTHYDTPLCTARDDVTYLRSIVREGAARRGGWAKTAGTPVAASPTHPAYPAATRSHPP